MSRSFPKSVQRDALARCGHHCEGDACNADIRFKPFQFDHRIRWELTRDSSLGNCQVLCIPCHLKKTSGETSTLAKGDRVADFHRGLRGPGKGRYPMRGGRRSRERKTFRHGVQPRVTLAQEHLRIMTKRYGRGR